MTVGSEGEEETESALVPIAPPASTAPDGGVWAWLTVLGQFINYFLIFGFCRIFTVFIQPMQYYYEISLTAINVIPAVFSIGLSVGGLCGGPVIEKLGVRKTALLFGIIPALTFVACYLSGTSYTGCTIGFTFLSLSFGLLFLCSLKSIAIYFDKRRTLAMQIGTCGTSVGQFVMAPAITTLLETYTVEGTYMVLSGLFLNLLVSACLFRPLKSSKTAAEKVVFDASIFRIPSFVLYLVSQLLLNCGYFGGILYVVPLTTGKFSVTPLKAANLVSIMAVTELLFRLPWGFISDKERVNRHYLLCFVMLCLGSSLAGFALCPSYNWLAVICGFSGIFQGGFGGLSFVTLGDFLKLSNKEGQLINGVGISTALNGAGIIVWAYFIGKLTEDSGNFNLVQIISGIMVILAGIMAAVISPLSHKYKIN